MAEPITTEAIGEKFPWPGGIMPSPVSPEIFYDETPAFEVPDLGAAAAIEIIDTDGLVEISRRFGMDPNDVRAYMSPGERLTGFGTGGSESLVFFVDTPENGRVVRKVCSEQLSSADWDPHGTGVMSPPSVKARHQVNYLMGLPRVVQPYFPEVFAVREMTVPRRDGEGTVQKLIYDQSFIDGTEVSTFIAEEHPTPSIVARLHREILHCLADKVHPHRVVENAGGTIEPSYLDKITARLELSYRTAPETFGPLMNSPDIVINGQHFRNIGELLAFFRKPEVIALLEPRYHSLVMGDTNTENVMITKPAALRDAMADGSTDFTYDDIGLMFLDPRAIGHNSAGADTVDDPMYDNKPVHNSIGNYDMIHGEYFGIKFALRGGVPHIDMEAKPDNPFKSSYQGMEKYFPYVMNGWNVGSEQFLKDDPNWLLRFTFMMGSHFAAMPPFHFKRGPDGLVTEDAEAQKRAIAIYCEGIKWLNRAYDMLTGKRRELYGISVPAVDLPIHAGAREMERLV